MSNSSCIDRQHAGRRWRRALCPQLRPPPAQAARPLLSLAPELLAALGSRPQEPPAPLEGAASAVGVAGSHGGQSIHATHRSGGCSSCSGEEGLRWPGGAAAGGLGARCVPRWYVGRVPGWLGCPAGGRLPHPGRPLPSPWLQAKKVDYMELPQPVRYEELQREVMSEWAAAAGPAGAWRRRQRRLLPHGRGARLPGWAAAAGSWPQRSCQLPHLQQVGCHPAAGHAPRRLASGPPPPPPPPPRRRSVAQAGPV